jgi:hypothetical protein
LFEQSLYRDGTQKRVRNYSCNGFSELGYS